MFLVPFPPRRCCLRCLSSPSLQAAELSGRASLLSPCPSRRDTWISSDADVPWLASSGRGASRSLQPRSSGPGDAAGYCRVGRLQPGSWKGSATAEGSSAAGGAQCRGWHWRGSAASAFTNVKGLVHQSSAALARGLVAPGRGVAPSLAPAAWGPALGTGLPVGSRCWEQAGFPSRVSEFSHLVWWGLGPG